MRENVNITFKNTEPIKTFNRKNMDRGRCIKINKGTLIK